MLLVLEATVSFGQVMGGKQPSEVDSRFLGTFYALLAVYSTGAILIPSPVSSVVHYISVEDLPGYLPNDRPKVWNQIPCPCSSGRAHQLQLSDENISNITTKECSY